MRALAGAALLLAGCQGESPTGSSAGSKLESAAVSQGLVVDPARRAITGSWSRDTDRACIVPGDYGQTRMGLLIDYGDGQGCAGSGTVARIGADLDVVIGGCRLAARIEGDRIVFSTSVPAECDKLCTGRATLAAMAVKQQSDSVSEATTLRAPSGRLLCGR